MAQRHRHPRFVSVKQVSKKVGTAAHLERVQQVTDASITVLRNESDVLPMQADGAEVLVTGYDAVSRTTVADQLEARGATTSISATATNPTAAEIAAAVAAAAGQDAVVVLTMNSKSSPGPAKLLAVLQESGHGDRCGAPQPARHRGGPAGPDLPGQLLHQNGLARVAGEGDHRGDRAAGGTPGGHPGRMLYERGAGLTW